MTDVYWFGEVSRISPEAPVPIVRMVRDEVRPGAAANVAANCTAMGAIVDLIGAEVAKKIRVVAKNQQVVRIDFDEEASPAAILHLGTEFASRLPLADAVIFSDYGRKSLTNVKALIAQARLAGKPVYVDPKGLDYERYALADMVKPNQYELRELMGGWADQSQLEKKAELLRRQINVGAVLVTQALEGMTLVDEEGAHHYPADAHEVYDVTGAGDTAIAAYAVASCMGCSPRLATSYANKAAGIVVGKFGTAVATEKEVFG